MCAAGAVPVALHRLGVERGGHVEVLGGAVQQPAGDPQLVGDLERAERADLELPLADHHLGVDAADRQAGGEAVVEVLLDDLAAEDLVGADAAVVAALRGREAADREAVRAAVLEERVLLLDAEQRLVLGVLLGRLHERRRGCWSGAACRRPTYTSHITRTSSPPRIGSGQREHRASSTQSLLSPVAWLVLEPSKPQIGSAAPSGTILVFERSFGRRLGAVDPDVLSLVDHVILRSSGAGVPARQGGRSPPRGRLRNHPGADALPNRCPFVNALLTARRTGG